MANIAIFRINYKSDFILTLNSDAGWLTPFCIKFWTGAPSQAYFAGYDGETYTHCAPVEGEPTKLVVQFDDHHLPIGDLKFQIGYHFTVADFPTSVEDEVINQASVIIEVNDAPAQVMLDLNGETAPEIEFSLPAYANEAQRIANEEERIEAEQQRIANEDARIQAEETRQQNEQQRIEHETARVNEFATLKSQSQAATRNANDAATLANQKAQLAADKAALADDAATLAIQKAQLAADKAALANDAAQLAADKAALAQQKAEYAQQQGGYAKDQGDYAKNQGDYAKAQSETAQADHERAESDHGIAANDHTQAGNDHTRAESDHGIAADDHTQAGNDHTRAESDHGIAVDDHTQAGNDHTRAESDHTRAESDHAAVEVYVDSLGAFDISAYHATGGVLAKYADLTAALGTNGANIPEALRKGGMSVKFVLSSDNKYVQWRLMKNTWSTTESDWQGVDDVPTEGSKNLVESGGVIKALYPLEEKANNTIVVYGSDKSKILIGESKEDPTIKIEDKDVDVSGVLTVNSQPVLTEHQSLDGYLNESILENDYGISEKSTSNDGMSILIGVSKIAPTIKFQNKLIDRYGKLFVDDYEMPSAKFLGRTIMYVGDSISTTNSWYWKGYLESLHGIKYMRYTRSNDYPTPAVGGITIRPKNTDPTDAWDADYDAVQSNAKSIWYRCAYNNLSRYSNDFDKINLFGGTNDQNANLLVGTVDDEPLLDTDIDDFSTYDFSAVSFASAYMGCIEMLQRDFPGKEIVLCTLLYNPRPLGSEISLLIVNIAQKYSLKCIPWYWSEINSSNYAQLCASGIHPKQVAAGIMARIYAGIVGY